MDRIGGHAINVNLTPRLEAMIRQKVETGLYNNSSEVVREAPRLLGEKDRLKSAIAVGDAQYARGETILFTPELVEEMKWDAVRMAEAGEQPDPDVRP